MLYTYNGRVLNPTKKIVYNGRLDANIYNMKEINKYLLETSSETNQKT
jgi:hypothetical protein